MMKTKVLIVEDEKLAAQKLTRQLTQLDPSNIEVVKVIDSVSATIAFLSAQEVDLIFMDIHLGDDLSFSIFESIKVTTPIIFTTAYDQYAIKAFKLNSIDYLLKPISKSDLAYAFNKFLEQKQHPIDYTTLLDSLRPQKEYKKRFMVHVGEKVQSINIDQISYFFAEGKYVYMVCHQGKQHLIDFTLDKLKEQLEPCSFFRINRQFIVHIDSIDEMIPYSKGRLKVCLKPQSTKDAIVSIERSSAFKKWLNQ